jgi:hypothetical protein
MRSCYNCQRPLREADFLQGRAIQVGSLDACEECAGPLLDRLDPEQRRAIFRKLEGEPPEEDDAVEVLPPDAGPPEPAPSRRTRSVASRIPSTASHPAAGRVTPTASHSAAGRVPPITSHSHGPGTPPPPPARPTALYALLGVGGAVLLALALLLLNRSDAPPESRPRPVEPAPGRTATDATDSRREAARAALQRARDRERERPDDADGIARLYDEAVQAAASTPLEAEARQARDAATARAREALAAETAALERDVRAIRDRREFQAALDHLAAVRGRRADPGWTSAADRILKEVRAAAEEEFGRLKAKVLEARRRGEGDAMAAAREEIGLWGMPWYVEELEKALAEETTRVAGEGLAGWWKLDDTEGVYAVDALGRFNGMVGGRPAWAPGGGKLGGALRFDGQDDDVRIPRESPLEPAAVTCMAWIRLDEAPIQWANVLRKTWRNNSGPVAASYALQLNPNGRAPTSIAFVTGSSDGNDILTSPGGLIAPGAWIHVAGVFDPKGPSPRKRIHINGKKVAGNDPQKPIAYDTTRSGDLYLGTNGRGDERFKGLMDDVRIYGRALSPSEIEAVAAGR